MSRATKRERVLVGVFATVAAFGVGACEQPVANSGYTLASGVYCLDADVNDAPHVATFTLGKDTVLDCRGHRIIDSTLVNQSAIEANGDNIVVKNCVFEGFSLPVFFYGASNFTITGNVFFNTRDTAISTSGTGLIAGNTFGYPIQGGGASHAIRSYGTVDIIGNTVLNGRAQADMPGQERVGFLIYSNHGGVVSGNLVRDLVGPASNERAAAMIVTDDTVVYRNTFIAAPGVGDIGVSCDMYALALQNVIVGYRYPLDGCVNFSQGH